MISSFMYWGFPSLAFIFLILRNVKWFTSYLISFSRSWIAYVFDLKLCSAKVRQFIHIFWIISIENDMIYICIENDHFPFEIEFHKYGVVLIDIEQTNMPNPLTVNPPIIYVCESGKSFMWRCFRPYNDFGVANFVGILFIYFESTEEFMAEFLYRHVSPSHQLRIHSWQVVDERTNTDLSLVIVMKLCWNGVWLLGKTSVHK